MKKFLAALIATLSVIAVIAFAGCQNGNNQESTASGNVYLDVQKVAFTVSDEVLTLTDTTTVKDYLDALSYNGEMKYEISNGFISSFYNTAGKVISSTANSYEGYDWAFYIDFTKLEGDDAVYATDYKTVEHGGKTLYSSSNGVEGTPCVKGHTYVFVYEYSNFSW